jgi:hypothetical protein
MSTELGAGDINRKLSGEFVFRVAKTQCLLYMEPKSKRVTLFKNGPPHKTMSRDINIHLNKIYTFLIEIFLDKLIIEMHSDPIPCVTFKAVTRENEIFYL